MIQQPQLLLTDDWRGDNLRGLANDDFAGESSAVDDCVAVHAHGSLTRCQDPDKTAFSTQRDGASVSENIKKHVVPLNIAGQDDPSALRQGKLFTDVENERGRRTAQER